MFGILRTFISILYNRKNNAILSFEEGKKIQIRNTS